MLLEILEDCPIPVVATLGNHDHESGNAAEVSRLFVKSGVHLLDRSSVVIDGVGFSGVKGFCGGFDQTLANAFGEDLFKAWVTEGLMEAQALENELRGLETERRVAVLHYAPVRATVEGEPPEIHAFLGTSHLARALDEGARTSPSTATRITGASREDLGRRTGLQRQRARPPARGIRAAVLHLRGLRTSGSLCGDSRCISLLDTIRSPETVL